MYFYVSIVTYVVWWASCGGLGQPRSVQPKKIFFLFIIIILFFIIKASAAFFCSPILPSQAHALLPAISPPPLQSPSSLSSKAS